MSLSNTPAAVIMAIFAALFGGLGFGSILKPKTIGVVASQFLKNLGRSSEEGSSDSHDSQVQKRSSGIQVMAHDQSSVSITVDSRKKKAQNRQEESENLQEKKKILCKETIVVRPHDGYGYDFEFMRGEHLRGEISSTNPVDVYFVDEPNFIKWTKNKLFNEQYSNGAVLETNIDYVVPKKGKWFVIIDNEGRKSATVKISLY
jgi:hypothetical protein